MHFIHKRQRRALSYIGGLGSRIKGSEFRGYRVAGFKGLGFIRVAGFPDPKKSLINIQK